MKDPDVADLVTLAVAIVVGLIAAAAIFAWLYVEVVYRERETDVREFSRIVRRDRRVVLGGAIIEAVIVWLCLSFLRPDLFPPLPRPWPSVFVGIVMALVLLGPIDDAVAWHRLRREARADVKLRAETDVLPPLEDDLP